MKMYEKGMNMHKENIKKMKKAGTFRTKASEIHKKKEKHKHA